MLPYSFFNSSSISGSLRTKSIRTLILAAVVFSLSSCVAVEQQTVPSQEPFKRGSRAMSFEEHLRLGAIYESNGNLGPALREYRSARKMRPSDSRPYFGIGNIQLRSGYFDDAEDSYKKAIKRNRGQGVYYNNLAWVYIKTNRFTDAYVMAKKGASRDLRRSYIYLDTIGVIEMRLGNYERAEQKLKEAVAAMPPSNRRGLLSVYENLRELYTIMTSRVDDMVEVEKRIEELRGSLGSTVPMLP